MFHAGSKRPHACGKGGTGGIAAIQARRVAEADEHGQPFVREIPLPLVHRTSPTRCRPPRSATPLVAPGRSVVAPPVP
jgi:hypothetical protein